MTSAPRSPRPANCEGGGGGGAGDCSAPAPAVECVTWYLAVPSTWSGDISPLCSHCALTAGIYKVTGAALKYYICDSIKHFVQCLLDARLSRRYSRVQTLLIIPTRGRDQRFLEELQSTILIATPQVAARLGTTRTTGDGVPAWLRCPDHRSPGPAPVDQHNLCPRGRHTSACCCRGQHKKGLDSFRIRPKIIYSKTLFISVLF